MILRNILIVGTGSFLGGAARYAISLLMKNVGKGFPWPTLVANLCGCLLILQDFVSREARFGVRLS